MAGKTAFITGASGFIGSAVTRAAIAKGYQVRGLSRSEESDEKIKKLGGVPVRGDLTSHDLLAREAANADIVCNLGDAFMGSKFTLHHDEAIKITTGAISAMAAALVGTNKPLIVSSGVRIVLADPNGGVTTEDDSEDENSYFDRRLMEHPSLAWAKRGVRVACIRIAPFVHGEGNLIEMMVQMAKSSGAAFTINGGNIYTSTVHVDDVGRLYILAAEKTQAGETYNAVAENDITFATFMGAIADAAGVPVKDLTPEEALAQLGPMWADYFSQPCRGYSEKAKKVLGLEIKEIGLLEHIKKLYPEAKPAED